MSILVTCQCGKRFKTGDQYAGKKSRCPACGQPITIPAAPVQAIRVQPQADTTDDLLSLAEPEVFQPTAAAPVAATSSSKKKSNVPFAPPLSKSNRPTGPIAVPRVSISPGIIVLIVLAIIIPAAIYWAKEGPMKAQADWQVISEKASDNITGQITRAIQHEYKDAGHDMTDMTFQPKATNTFFDNLGLMLKMPDTVSFQGSGTEGHFSGTFHPKTWRFEVDAPLRTSRNMLHITGSASETDQSLEIDGKPVKD